MKNKGIDFFKNSLNTESSFQRLQTMPSSNTQEKNDVSSNGPLFRNGTFMQSQTEKSSINNSGLNTNATDKPKLSNKERMLRLSEQISCSSNISKNAVYFNNITMHKINLNKFYRNY